MFYGLDMKKKRPQSRLRRFWAWLTRRHNYSGTEENVYADTVNQPWSFGDDDASR